MKSLFLIAPYYVDPFYVKKKSILDDLCKSFSIKLQIAEDLKTGNSLNAEDTIRLLKKSDFFIADLSFERPSCYYEVGYLQALNKKVNLISTANTSLHQLLRNDSLLTYSDLDSYKTLVENILKAELASG